jgi:D-glycero-D-manno-heptose 1,7-bisphosphate phosphatase
MHDDHHKCTCRKPKPGMIMDLAEKNNINLEKSFVIGDGWKDIKAGSAAGCTTILIEKPYNKNVSADFIVTDLKKASKIILE